MIEKLVEFCHHCHGWLFLLYCKALKAISMVWSTAWLECKNEPVTCCRNLFCLSSQGCGLIFPSSILYFCSVFRGNLRIWKILGLHWVAMFEPCEGHVHITRHRKVHLLLVVIPIKSECNSALFQSLDTLKYCISTLIKCSAFSCSTYVTAKSSIIGANWMDCH